MKIRYYREIDGWRWIGFVLAMIGAFILSGGDPDVQWMGWVVALFSCSIWIYMGIKDKDTPRALMEAMYMLLAFRGIWNWVT
jgi:drug/metabolite transporter (DMT)-like permease|tara:strand:+ start:178 stop:423 length:246 start_codon:yes stop_codon:yes gene_type:complete